MVNKVSKNKPGLFALIAAPVAILIMLVFILFKRGLLTPVWKRIIARRRAK